MASPADQPTGDTQDITVADPILEIVDDNTVEEGPLVADSGGVIATGAGAPAAAVPVDTIVNLGKFAWDVIKDNRPVANATSDNASAVPSGANWSDLSGWDPNPRVMRLHYHTENIFGMGTDIYLTTQWYFNGQYQGGGQYINAATVVATGDVAEGQTINVTASISNPMNLGTRDNPVAALPVKITVQQSNVFQNFTSGWTGLVQGNGGGHLDPVS